MIIHEGSCFRFVRSSADRGGSRLRPCTTSTATATTSGTDDGTAASTSADGGTDGVPVADTSDEALRKGLASGRPAPHAGGQIGPRALRTEPLTTIDASQ